MRLELFLLINLVSRTSRRYKTLLRTSKQPSKKWIFTGQFWSLRIQALTMVVKLVEIQPVAYWVILMRWSPMCFVWWLLLKWQGQFSLEDCAYFVYQVANHSNGNGSLNLDLLPWMYSGFFFNLLEPGYIQLVGSVISWDFNMAAHHRRLLKVGYFYFFV
jgi:hypothetical protein